MPQRERGQRQLFQAGDEEIGVAQAAGFHAEQDLAGGGFPEVERFDGDGSAGAGEDGGSAVGTAHGEEYNKAPEARQEVRSDHCTFSVATFDATPSATKYTRASPVPARLFGIEMFT